MSRRKGSGQRRVARKHYIIPLLDDRGHPHPQDAWESLLPEVKAGRLIRKRRHEAPKLDDMDPNFGEEYDEATHGHMNVKLTRGMLPLPAAETQPLGPMRRQSLRRPLSSLYSLDWQIRFMMASGFPNHCWLQNHIKKMSLILLTLCGIFASTTLP